MTVLWQVYTIPVFIRATQPAHPSVDGCNELVIREIINIYCRQMSHILMLKCTKFDSWSLSVCLCRFVHLFVYLLDGPTQPFQKVLCISI